MEARLCPEQPRASGHGPVSPSPSSSSVLQGDEQVRRLGMQLVPRRCPTRTCYRGMCCPRAGGLQSLHTPGCCGTAGPALQGQDGEGCIGGGLQGLGRPQTHAALQPQTTDLRAGGRAMHRPRVQNLALLAWVRVWAQTPSCRADKAPACGQQLLSPRQQGPWGPAAFPFSSS